MKERPILFSAPMVRAILAGKKTQTRRVVNPQPIALQRGEYRPGDAMLGPGGKPITARHGLPGDRLWVRETWGYFDPDDTGEDYDDEHETAGPGPVAFCDELLQEGHPLRDFWRRRVAYKATFAEGKYGAGPLGPKKWRPSIHMPRWASRITLEVTGVRVERLQDISNTDALSEGITSVRNQAWDRQHFPEWRFLFDEAVQAGEKPPIGPTPAQSFAALWDSINGIGAWGANPWVWVIEFKRVET